MKCYFLFFFIIINVQICYSYDILTGATRGNYLKLNNNVRSAGMGDSYIAISDDTGAMFFNPAGLAQINSTEFSSTYSSWLGGTSFTSGSIISHSGELIFGCNLNYYNFGGFELTTLSQPKGTGQIITPFAAEFDFSIGRKMDLYSSYGGNFKIIYEKILDKISIGYGIDVGILWDIGDNYHFGINAKNIISSFGEGLIYKNYGAGISYKLPELIFGLDLNAPNDNKIFASIGGEYNINDILFSRLGFNTKSEKNAMGNFSAGLGLKFQNLKIDYAYVPYSDLGITHRVSVALSLASKKDLEITQFEIIPKVEKFILGKYYLLEARGYNNRLNKIDIAPSWEVSGGEIKKSESGTIIFKAARIGKGYIKVTQNNSSFTEKINISN